MRSLVVIIFAIFLSVIQADYIKKTWDSRIATKNELIKQMKIYDLLNHVDQRNWHREQISQWEGTADFLEQNAHNYNKKNATQQYLSVIPLHKNKIPTHLNRNNYKEISALFDLLYYSKDFDVFYKTACWARDNVNAEIFIQAFTTAFFHRKDCRDLVLPPLYETYPFLFVQADVQSFVSQIKQQGGFDEPKMAQVFGIDIGTNENFTITNSFRNVFKRDSDDEKLTYFTQDVGLNMYNYLYYAEYPPYLTKKEYGLSTKIRGELFFYMHQQLIARYQLERLSNKIKELDASLLVDTVYNPNMAYRNGFPFPNRPENFTASSDENMKLIEKFTQFEESTVDHIKQFSYFKDKEEALKELGHIYISSEEPYLLKKAYGGSFFKDDFFSYIPSALERPETSIRDPIFYKIHQMFLSTYLEVKRKFPPYNEELSFPGVKVESLEHSQLTTFFESFEFDISNLVYLNKKEQDENEESITFKARQERLNHKSFTFILQVSAEKEANAAIRMFLGPKYDPYGRLLRLNESRLDFIELDSFMYALKPGKNFIIRKDHEFARTSEDSVSTRTMSHQILSALNNGEPLEISETKPRNNWPTNLLLPRGSEGGLELRLYVIVTKFKKWEVSSTNVSEFRNTVGITNSALVYDDKPFGFPFDRDISEQILRRPNVLTFDLKIYHV